MAESVAERIMQHIHDTLAGVTVANGYANTLHTVQRLEQEGQASPVGNTVILVDGDDSIEGTSLGGVFDVLSRRRQVDLVIVAQHDAETDGRSASELMNSLEADIRTAMQVDIQRGGLAVNTEETQAGETDVQIGMPELRRVLGYAIRYRHRRTDPTIAG